MLLAVVCGSVGRSVPACPGLVHQFGYFLLVQALAPGEQQYIHLLDRSKQRFFLTD